AGPEVRRDGQQDGRRAVPGQLHASVRPRDPDGTLMGRPAFLVDNLLNPRIYPGHSLSASSTASGTTVRSLSAGRRRRSLTGWWASALNTAAYVQVVFDQPRAFNCLWLDRDHNLTGEQVGLAM